MTKRKKKIERNPAKASPGIYGIAASPQVAQMIKDMRFSAPYFPWDEIPVIVDNRLTLETSHVYRDREKWEARVKEQQEWDAQWQTEPGRYQIQRGHHSRPGRWEVVGEFVAGSPWRDGRPVNDETMREELQAYRKSWPTYFVRVRCPNGLVLSEGKSTNTES